MKGLLAVFFLCVFCFFSIESWATASDLTLSGSNNGRLAKLQDVQHLPVSEDENQQLTPNASPKKYSSLTASTNVNSLSNWPLVLATLVGMVCLILALAWMARRFGGVNFSRNKDMRIVSTLSLGTRERVTLIEVNGQKILLGITTHNINLLHTFDELVFHVNSDGNRQGNQEGDMKSEFAEKLTSILSRSPDNTNNPKSEHQK